MTVVLIAGETQAYVGASSDTKPAAPRTGATFYETDTRLYHVFDGAVWKVRLGET